MKRMIFDEDHDAFRDSCAAFLAKHVTPHLETYLDDKALPREFWRAAGDEGFLGLEIPEESIWTSALATATFLGNQRPNGTAYVVGESGLTTALHDIGYIITDIDPDYVVLGETRTYSFEAITTAIRLVERGARFIATNPDATGPSRDGSLPATGSVAALITRATGREPYYVGKPNALMMRSALRAIGAHLENTLMIGDRMDTDIVSGLEAGLQTILVLTGISTPASVEMFPFRPTRVIESVADLIGHTANPFG